MRTVTRCPSTKPRCGVTVRDVNANACDGEATAGSIANRAKQDHRAAGTASSLSAIGFKMCRPPLPRPERSQALPGWG